jgi:4-hydroxy-tetrahydrodipicolinate reductase
MEKIKLAILGKSGKMGQLLALEAEKQHYDIVGGIDLSNNCLDKKIAIDIIIDFSSPLALMNNIDKIVAKKIPLITGTTGLSSNELKELKEASKIIPVLYSSNYSIGVNVLNYLVSEAAKKLKGLAEVEIIEKHHRNKKDAPSGTAKTLGDLVAKEFATKNVFINGRSGTENKRKGEIAFHALRGGNIVGEHQVHFILNNEMIEIKHEALSRSIFVEGALAAIPFVIKQKRGYFEFKDIIKEII